MERKNQRLYALRMCVSHIYGGVSVYHNFFVMTDTRKLSPAPTKNELLILSKGQAVTTSRKIANVFGKNHNDVLRDVRNLGCSDEFSLRNFAQSNYKTERGKEYPEFLITRDGFVMLAMGYTGEKAMSFKELYIAQFNAMEEKLRSSLLPAERDGIFKGLIPMLHDGRKCYLYSHALTAIGYSRKSGSVHKRTERHPNHFFRLYGRVMISAEYANLLKAQYDFEKARQQMQLSIEFPKEKGGAA